MWRHTLIKKHTQTELSDPGCYPAFPCCDSCERSHALPSPSTPLFSCFPLCLVFFLFLPLFSLFYNSLRCFSFVLRRPICTNNVYFQNNKGNPTIFKTLCGCQSLRASPGLKMSLRSIKTQVWSERVSSLDRLSAKPGLRSWRTNPSQVPSLVRTGQVSGLQI